MVQQIKIQSQIMSYKKKFFKFKKIVLDAALTLSIIRYGTRVKWNNPGNEVAPFPTPQCGSYWKGSSQVTPDSGRQLYFTFISI